MDGKSSYLPAVDGLRAIAVLAVVAYHAGLPVPGGFVGVDVFFVISGYLITRLLRDELASTGRIDFVAFYSRRARRLLPAMTMVVMVVLVLAPALLPPLEAKQAGQAAAAAFVFSANLYFALSPSGYFDGDIQSNPLLHLWSLGVEEQFYVFWPLAMLLARRRQTLALMLVAGLSFAAAEWLLASGRSQAAFFQAPARAWELAIGGLIAVRRLRVPQCTGYVGLAVVAAACFIGFDRFPGSGALPPTLGAAMVVAAADAGRRIRPLEARPVVWLGLISYSLYLWHWPVMALGGLMPMASQLALSFLLAAGSYLYVEQPFRRRRGFPARPTVAASILLSAAGAGLALTASRPHAVDELGNSQLVAALQTRAPPIRHCDDWYHSSDLKPCIFGDADAEQTAVILGDSVVMQWFSAVHSIFDRPGWRVVVLTKSACPMVDEPFDYVHSSGRYVQCETWRDNALAWLERERPDVVITGSANNYGFTREQWRDGSRRVVARLSASAGQVMLVRSTPRLVPGGSRTYDEVHQWEGEAIQGLANVRLIDMNAHVCPDRQCRREVDGQIVFRDSRHVAPAYAQSLSHVLRAKIEREEPR